MLPLNHVTHSSTSRLPPIIRTASSVYPPLIVNKQQQQQQGTGRRRRTKTSTVTTSSTTTITSLVSVNALNINSTISASLTSTQHQNSSTEEAYSAKTGIKTAALLGGMLFLVILYLVWKARARLCRPSRSSAGGSGAARVSGAKFDLDYWLKQVDILEAKEAERNRGGQALYLELPNQEPRDNRQATASWIVDTYRHWRLVQYRQHQQLFRQDSSSHLQTERNPVPYRRRRNPLRRLYRRFLVSSQQNPSFLMEQAPSLIAGMRPSIVSNTFVPPPLASSAPPRRTASWPRLKSTHNPTGAPMSALQTHLVRKRLLKRTSRSSFDL